MKKVRVTVELDEHFVRLLNANVGLSKWGEIPLGGGEEMQRQHTASEALAVVVLAEARGATEEQVHIVTPMEWRNNIRAVHELREVEEV